MQFHIESTSFCENGVAPRWTWWLHGIARTARFGVVGTDEQGRGLYLFHHDRDRAPERIRLVGPEAFSIPQGLSKYESCLKLARALEGLGWGTLGKMEASVVGANPVPITGRRQPQRSVTSQS